MREMLIYDFCRYWYWPLNGTTVNVVHDDDLHSQGHKFWIASISIYEWISQNSNGSSNWCAGDNTKNVYLFPKKLLSFPGGVVNTYSQQTVQLIRDFFADYDQGTRGSIKKRAHKWRLPHNLVSILQVENVSRGKKNVEFVRHHSTDFNQGFTKMIAL